MSKIILGIIIIALALNSIFNKINIDEKGKKERWMINSISILSVSFLLLFIYLLYQDYRDYDIEFLWENLSYNLIGSFWAAFTNMIIYQPIFWSLVNLKMKNIYQIILAIILIIIIDFLIFAMNFSLVF